MRSLLATFLTFLSLIAIVLVAAFIGALGVGAIGWVLARAFDLSQWQGTLVALGTTLGASFLAFQLGGAPAPVIAEAEYADWDDEVAVEEMETPTMRRRGSARGQLPADTPGSKGRPTKK